MVGPDGFLIVALPVGKNPKEHAGAFCDAAYIALANPTYILSVLEELSTAQKDRDTWYGSMQLYMGVCEAFSRELSTLKGRLAAVTEAARNYRDKYGTPQVHDDLWKILEATPAAKPEAVQAGVTTIPSPATGGTRTPVPVPSSES